MTIKIIDARQARMRFSDDEFVQSLKAVNEAILDASTTGHSVVVNVPTGKKEGSEWSNSYHVARRLQQNGFEVKLIHDPENGSSELTVDWSRLVEGKEYIE